MLKQTIQINVFNLLNFSSIFKILAANAQMIDFKCKIVSVLFSIKEIENNKTICLAVTDF